LGLDGAGGVNRSSGAVASVTTQDFDRLARLKDEVWDLGGIAAPAKLGLV
jgi:hypothetical protein